MINATPGKEIEDEEEAGLLDNQRGTNSSISGEELGSDIPLCGFLSVRFYKPYFDVDTKDISNRLYHSILYLKKDDSFMTIIAEKPDAYGPFWIATSLIFAISVASHISSFLSSWMSGKPWSYDFQSVLTLASIVYSFSCGVPGLIWFALRQFNAKLRLITAICLYGYSLLIFVPASLLSWALFLFAGSISTLFLLRNLAPIILAHTAQNAAAVLGVIGFLQFVFTLSLKFNFRNSATTA